MKVQNEHPLWALLEQARNPAITCAKAFWIARGNIELADVFADLYLAEPRSLEEGAIVGAWRPRSVLRQSYFKACRDDEALTSKRFVSLRDVYQSGSEWNAHRLTPFQIELESTRVRRQIYYRFRFSFFSRTEVALIAPELSATPEFCVRLRDGTNLHREIVVNNVRVHAFADNNSSDPVKQELRVRGIVVEESWLSGCIEADNTTRAKYRAIVDRYWVEHGTGSYDGLLLGVEGWSLKGFQTSKPSISLTLNSCFYREKFFLENHLNMLVDPSFEVSAGLTYREWCRLGGDATRCTVPPIQFLQFCIAILVTGESPFFVWAKHPRWRQDVLTDTPTTPVRSAVECTTLDEHETPPLKSLAVVRLYEEIGLRITEDDLHFTGFGMVPSLTSKTWTPTLFGLAVCKSSKEEFLESMTHSKFADRFVDKIELIPTTDLFRRLREAPNEPGRDAAHMLAMIYLGQAEVKWTSRIDGSSHESPPATPQRTQTQEKKTGKRFRR